MRIVLGIADTLYMNNCGIHFRFGLYYWKWFGVYPRLAMNVCYFGLVVARLSGHNSQWVFASLFIISAAFRMMEILTLSK